jgi:2-polyprenyl-3-methyl-5-hydroxy-6-metoxy-1,4-benzoquinol methylase
LIDIQIAQPQQERKIAFQIRCLSEIKDTVSQKVQQQYEANPYPRWLGLAANRPVPFINYLQADIRPNTLAQFPALDHPQVLIAGCGTGSQPISCAQAYKNAAILAIDLSLPSLAYAKRKSDEFGVANVEFMQADILDLPVLGKAFDVIECMGVLHHMADPVQGWRTLLELLKPNGFMKIGLYSEYARQSVVAARAMIQANGYESDPAGIRACRQAILTLPDQDAAKEVIGVPDFYATSSVRDLLFHEQEHRFSLPEIAGILTELNLELLGFVTDSDIKAAYGKTYPDDARATSLIHWHQFELDHPNTFWGMYKFWIKRK